MRNLILVIGLYLCSVCRADYQVSNLGDSISNLTTWLNSEGGEGGLWSNGLISRIGLSSNSSPTQVVVKAAAVWRIASGTNDTLRILEIRTIEMRNVHGSSWIAALVECSSGKKILLFHFEGRLDDWWTRFYNVKDEGPNTPSQGSSQKLAP